MQKEDFCDDHEDWEDDADLINNEDWVGLLELRKERAKNHPDDLFAQQRYGEALVINKKFVEAIDFLAPLYKRHYEDGFGIQEIMEALIGLGKTEMDFNWVNNPKIYRLNDQILELCIKTLTGKRKHVDLFDLYEKFLLDADYVGFSQEELVEFLLKYPEMFSFEGDPSFPRFLTIKLKK